MSADAQPRPARILGGRLVGAAFLDEPRLRRAWSALDGNGEEVRAVGGAVRNALLGLPAHDVDLATTSPPQETMARAKAAGLRAIPTGFEHGTVTILVDGAAFEATTLREDVETHGRHATVRFGRDFRMDALRRDFTMNALSVDAAGGVHDYCGGEEDIAARRVRFIGDAGRRIREDYLRILRLFRFHAAYGEGALDAEALHAAITLRAGLDGLSRERVRAELMKLFVARRAADVVADMVHCGVLGDVLGGIANPLRLARLKAIEAARGAPADAVLRLAAAAVLIDEDAERLRERLRLSNAEASRLKHGVAAHAALGPRDVAPDPRELRTLLFERGRRAALDALTLAHADSRAAADDPRWTSAFAFLTDTPEPQLPFSGSDLLARGVSAGPGLGATLKRLQAAWIRAGFPRDPEEIARLLDEATQAR